MTPYSLCTKFLLTEITFTTVCITLYYSLLLQRVLKLLTYSSLPSTCLMTLLPTLDGGGDFESVE